MELTEETPFQSMYSEKPIKAVVGGGKTIFYIHPGALLQGSSALTARVTGSWKTAGQETLDWSDFDEETMNCVLKFCYTREYNVPQHSCSSKGEAAPEKSAVSPAEDNARSGSPPMGRNHNGEAIVIHAKVYSFAHRYLVGNLQDYALFQMRICLNALLGEHTISYCPNHIYIKDAIQIIYGSTISREEIGMDPARRELCNFVATSPGDFRLHFVTPQEENGEFMVDLAFRLSGRLADFEYSNSVLEKKTGTKRRRNR
ncbi:uncharacterized protein N7479_006661 [Penicillium vulpinum]|uniref:BTB domain-containing protein n=1 Tax=Penicillium vulpinum TaxID=29845 RepID=A0A1V6RZ82_9EURO|nr:uncharacterized protein N7479_006661 [Penicillium vulpinum]KAJ5959511.1 hypothetical protein N7479_006661 [Penicillium vulpinum]OQE06819.1 hypothetical protein PENVUL_c016G00281 [Penicillium vulpinum]